MPDVQQGVFAQQLRTDRGVPITMYTEEDRPSSSLHTLFYRRRLCGRMPTIDPLNHFLERDLRYQRSEVDGTPRPCATLIFPSCGE
ncbi:uncharacterized protein ARMOST_15180 [Armillaria ostoyae]|uniref:Uncharacterized protein n=1 Tax=Armillaria ostoyae TaxID=47428 RepID=A0A284RSN1_ARMOS|nr:uncharacterized protein ARMOST_15180 [Armillaria ostoyae]